MSTDVLAKQASRVGGWRGPSVTAPPVSDGGVSVDEIVRVERAGKKGDGGAPVAVPGCTNRDIARPLLSYQPSSPSSKWLKALSCSVLIHG